MTNNEERLLIRIPGNLKKRLMKHAAGMGLNMSEFIRRSLSATMSDEKIGEPVMVFGDKDNEIKVPLRALKKSRLEYEIVKK